MHLDVNSLLNRRNKLCYIFSSSNAAVIEMTETHLDNAVYDSEHTVDGYNIVCYIRNNIWYNMKALTIYKPFSLMFCFQKPSLYRWKLYTNPRVKPYGSLEGPFLISV